MRGKVFLLLYVVFLGNPAARAEDPNTCQTCNENPVIVPSVLESISLGPLQKKRAYHPVDSKAIDKAHCRGSVPDEAGVKKFLAGFKLREPIVARKVIRGIHFEGEPQSVLDSFQKLITKVDDSGASILEQENFQNKYRINPACKKVYCAVQRIFGNTLGPKLLYLNLRYGFNGSHLAYFENSSPYSGKELDRILQGLSDFPEFIFPIEKNRKLIRFKKGESRSLHILDSKDVTGNATIELFDAWSQIQEPQMQVALFSHELGHVIGMGLNLQESPVWTSLSKWEKKEDRWISHSADQLVSGYAQEGPREDFAEAIIAYRYNPDLLKKISIQKYQLLKELVFQGVEYTSSEVCKTSHSYLDKIAKMSKSRSQEIWIDLKRDIPKAIHLDRCKEESIDWFIEIDKGSSLERCLDKSLNHEFLSRAARFWRQENQTRIKEPVFHQAALDLFAGTINGSSQYQASLGQKDWYRNLVKKVVQEEVVRSLVNWDKNQPDLYSWFGKNRSKPAPEFCKVWSNYGYQAFSSFKKGLPDQDAIFFKKDEVNAWVFNICLKIQNQKKSREPMKAEDFERAIGR